MHDQLIERPLRAVARMCRCLHECHDKEINGTCYLEEGGYCFTNVRTFTNDITDRIEQEVVYGCFPSDVKGLLQCKGDLSPHQMPMKIRCCQNDDYCNEKEPIPWFNDTFIEELNRKNEFDQPWDRSSMAVASILIFIVLCTIINILWLCYKKRKELKNDSEKKLSESSDPMEKRCYTQTGSPGCKPLLSSRFDYHNLVSPRPPLYNHMLNTTSSISDGSSSLLHYKHALLNNSHNSSNFGNNSHYRVISSATSNTTSSFASEVTQQTTLSSQKTSTTLPPVCEDSVTSGSGSGSTLMVRKTLAHEIHLIECIGHGRYGNVWRGQRHGESVAVKIFFSREEASWRREMDIYNTVVMRHENILGFFGADVTSQNGATQMWLVTEFVQLGSMYDYLNRNPIESTIQLLSLINSIICGIFHLHTEILGTQFKPAIAHRDIKSKNILMRSGFSCCIADFGLAVTKTQTNQINIAQNHRVGTKRYMAPEVLEETIKSDIFESYRYADIYSLGLVFWELFNRLQIDGIVAEYQVPFQNYVPKDPSFEDMRSVVCEKQIRPPFNQTLISKNPNLLPIQQLISECWVHKASARLTSMRIKKTILEMLIKEEKNCISMPH